MTADLKAARDHTKILEAKVTDLLCLGRLVSKIDNVVYLSCLVKQTSVDRVSRPMSVFGGHTYVNHIHDKEIRKRRQKIFTFVFVIDQCKQTLRPYFQNIHQLKRKTWRLETQWVSFFYLHSIQGLKISIDWWDKIRLISLWNERLASLVIRVFNLLKALLIARSVFAASVKYRAHKRAQIPNRVSVLKTH